MVWVSTPGVLSSSQIGEALTVPGTLTTPRRRRREELLCCRLCGVVLAPCCPQQLPVEQELQERERRRASFSRSPAVLCSCIALLLQCSVPAVLCSCSALLLQCSAPAVLCSCSALPLQCSAPAVLCSCSFPLPFCHCLFPHPQTLALRFSGGPLLTAKPNRNRLLDLEILG